MNMCGVICLRSLNGAPEIEPTHDADGAAADPAQPDHDDVGVDAACPLVDTPRLLPGLGGREQARREGNAPDDGRDVHVGVVGGVNHIVVGHKEAPHFD